jgi:hypothetical protein
MKYIKNLVLVGCVTAGISAAAQVDWSQLPPASTQSGVTFTNDIEPLFKASCVRCHGAARPRAQLRLDTLEGVLKGTKNGPVLTVGDSANSLIVKSISQLDPKTAMPPKRRPRGPGGPGGPMAGGPGGPPPGGPQPQGTNAPGMRPRNFGPPPKPLTAEQVGLVRAWIDQGAK